MEQRLLELWYRHPAAPSPLQPLSWLYAMATAARRGAYERGWFTTHHVAKPVVVVGNLTVGGTGKTPLVIWLATRLTERGYRVGLVSRGYARQRHRLGDAVVPGVTAGEQRNRPRFVKHDSRWIDVGDEPLLLHNRTGCPTVVARDRVAGAHALVSQGVDVIIADDGLQHLRLARDCEIIVVDGARGFGNGRVLPGGPLRESVSRLSTADLVVMNGAPEHPSLRRADAQLLSNALEMSLIAREARRVDATAENDADALASDRAADALGDRQASARRPLEAFRGQRVHAVAGIGNPARFFRDLRSRGIDVIEHAFPDHHPFAARDLEFADELPVLMTEKDAVKCQAFANPRLWYVPVEATFGDAQGRELLDQVLRKIGSQRAPLAVR